MRYLQAIIEDLRLYLSKRGLAEDLESLDEEMRTSPDLENFYSNVGTWLITYQVIEMYDETIQDLIREYLECCHSRGIFPP